MKKVKNILLSPVIAFQFGLIARSIGLLIFTIGIAHRWPMAEIARFESISIFQYILFFSWFPAMCIVMLRQGNKGKQVDQKSFLISILAVGLAIVLMFFILMMVSRSYFLPWTDISKIDALLLLLLMLSYFILQSQVYIFYLNHELKRQWILSIGQCLSWVILIWCTQNTHEFLIWINVISILTLIVVKPGFGISPIEIHKEFWKEVASYSIYLSFGAATVIIAAYYVQFNYGLNDELNWYRYGTRELPLLPTLIAGFGQSFLIQNPQDHLSLDRLKSGIAFYFKVLVLPLVILIICSIPIFRFLYGIRFDPAATLMSTSLLIYIPRMIPSATLLQYYDNRRALLWIGMIEFVFISIALFALGPRISLIHIVWILIAGTMIEKIMQVTVLYHIHRISIGKYLPMFWFVCWSLLLILAYSLQLNIVWN